jgi:DNA (cytosine-5)-methyltransferase 1
MSSRTDVSLTKKPVFVDVFAGCGALSLGLMQAGLQGKFAIERDKFAFATLQANLLSGAPQFKFDWPRWLPQEPTSIASVLRNHHDKLAALEGEVDVLVGGPPCQGFSSAGRRKHDDPRNKLFSSYLRLVDILRPKVVLIENVRGFTLDFTSTAGVKNYSRRLRDKLSARYNVFEELLDLSQFGVPQLRTRYFLIAIDAALSAANPFDLLNEQLPSFLRSLRLTAPVTSWAAISDLEISRGGKQASRDTPGFDEIRYTNPRTQFQKVMNAGATQLTDVRLARHSAEITERFREIIEISHAEGRLNTSISKELRAQFGLRKMALRVLDPDRPSPTVTSLPDDLLHYSEPRALTVRENARLQSFPDWFSFKGKYTTGGHLRKKEVPRFTQVANAVPPLVARAFGGMLATLFSTRRSSLRGIGLRRGSERRQQRVKILAEA